jgi:peptidoglycan/LPS O-acetylase OafA/YrhL
MTEQREPEQKRYHALDSLRASMMLLGIWLHTVVGYSRQGGWPYKDAHPTAAFDWTLGLIHSFRMPVFMAMAGFFSALLWTRRGPSGFADNRVRRVLFPFVLGWLAVYPLSLWMAAYSKTGSAAAATGFFVSGAFLSHLHPGHLWFLEYLLVLYLLAAVLVPLLERLPVDVLGSADGLFRGLLQSPWRTVAFAVPNFLVLCTMRHGFLDDPPGFLPVPRIVLAYAVLFAFGWALYVNRDLLATFERDAWRNVALAGAVVVGYVLVVGPREAAWGPAARFVRAGAVALLLAFVTFGMTGLFLRYFSTERPLWRYLSDGSYWIYVVHMPVVMAFQLLLASAPIATELKVLVVVALSCVVLVASYDLLARPTWIGVLLNGRRSSRRYFVGSARRERLAQPAEQPRPAGCVSAARSAATR